MKSSSHKFTITHTASKNPPDHYSPMISPSSLLFYSLQTNMFRYGDPADSDEERENDREKEREKKERDAKAK